jgi:hypothetical protein
MTAGGYHVAKLWSFSAKALVYERGYCTALLSLIGPSIKKTTDVCSASISHLITGLRWHILALLFHDDGHPAHLLCDHTVHIRTNLRILKTYNF